MEFLPPREQCSVQSSAFLCETDKPAWCCLICDTIHEGFGAECLLSESFHGESIEDLTKHVESTFHKRIELDRDGTEVWWDINSCPVPNDVDASQVVPIIKELLEKSNIPPGYLTISAMGDLELILKRTPHVLRAISSSGVLLKHVPKVR